jgi:uncharacterized protein YoxC
MIISEQFLSMLVSIALTVTAISPIVLLVLLVRDWRKRQLW